MKINPNLEPQGGHAATETGAAAGPGSVQSGRATQTSHSGGSDKTEFSSQAQEFAKLSAQIASIPEVRQERVASLRQAIQGGTYKVSDQQIAQSMLRDLGK